MNYYFDDNNVNIYNNIRIIPNNNSFLSSVSTIYQVNTPTGALWNSPPTSLNICSTNQNKINQNDTCYYEQFNSYLIGQAMRSRSITLNEMVYDSITASIWVLLPNISNSDSFLFAITNSSFNMNFSLSVQTTLMKYLNFSPITINPQMANNCWHHFAFSFSAPSQLFYVLYDDLIATSLPYTNSGGQLLASYPIVTFGSDTIYYMRHFKIYREFKTITFLKKDRYSEPVWKYVSTSYSSVIYSPDLILWFPLDEISGNTFYDWSPSSLNFTINSNDDLIAILRPTFRTNLNFLYLRRYVSSKTFNSGGNLILCKGNSQYDSTLNTCVFNTYDTYKSSIVVGNTGSLNYPINNSNTIMNMNTVNQWYVKFWHFNLIDSTNPETIIIFENKCSSSSTADISVSLLNTSTTCQYVVNTLQSASLIAKRWYNVIVSYSINKLTIYINGVSSISSTTSSTLAFKECPINFGRSASRTNQNLFLLRDFGFSNNILDLSNISNYYSSIPYFRDSQYIFYLDFSNVILNNNVQVADIVNNNLFTTMDTSITTLKVGSFFPDYDQNVNLPIYCLQDELVIQINLSNYCISINFK